MNAPKPSIPLQTAPARKPYIGPAALACAAALAASAAAGHLPQAAAAAALAAGVAAWYALFAAGRRRRKALALWTDVAARIGSRSDAAGLRAALLEFASDIGASSCSVLFYDEAARAFRDAPGGHLRVGLSHPVVAYSRTRPGPFRLDEGAAQGNTAIGALSAAAGCDLCAPLVTGGEVAGLLLIEGRGRVRYTKTEFALIRAAATLAAVQLRNIRLKEEMAERRETQALSRMSAFVLHDLKNFTNSLALLSHNARRNISNPEFQREAVKAIEGTVSRMKTLVERLAAPGWRTNERAACSLALPLRAAMERLAGAGAAVKADLTGAPECLMDAEAVESVFHNLLANALEAAGEGAEVAVSFSREDGYAVVRVTDNGGGIPAPLLENGIFRPFRTNKRGGYGIGLLQCRAVMEAHRGHIEAESAEGSGTVFTLRFPLDAAPARQACGPRRV